MPRPPDHENKELVWPEWPLKFRTSSSQEEGAARDFSVATEKLTGKDGKVTALHCVKLDAKLRPTASFHSRANGKRHGVTSVAEFAGRVLVGATPGTGPLRWVKP
jgi:NADPH-dependent glutamate synthase beta subunit-like oxidoreductase